MKFASGLVSLDGFYWWFCAKNRGFLGVGGDFYKIGIYGGCLVKMADFCGVRGGQVTVKFKLKRFIKVFAKQYDVTEKSLKIYVFAPLVGYKKQ